MNIQWNKVIVHNFGSYGHSEVELKDKGFCLVSGENNFRKDNALSNGSGKSFLWSAICFTLTGETIQGLKRSLKNIFIDEKLCYTTVDFLVDKDHYIITRYIEPKSNLTIIKNDLDISGKTFTESEKILGDTLPDLTKDLIATTCLIGQGMPNKFSSFTPKGRKELLEKLTKSDFMIEEVKRRIVERTTVLTDEIRAYDDGLLIDNTKLSTADQELTRIITELDNAVIPDYDKLIAGSEAQCISIQKDIDITTNNIAYYDTNIEAANNDLLKFTQAKSDEILSAQNDYNQASIETTTDVATYRSELNSLDREIGLINQEIVRLKAVKDICPTCGQKIPGVLKPSTTAQEQAIQEKQTEKVKLTEALNISTQKAATLKADYETKQQAITNKYSSALASIQAQLTGFKNAQAKAKNDLNDFNHYLTVEKDKINKWQAEKANIDKYYAGLRARKDTLIKDISILKLNISNMTAAKVNATAHLDTVKKLDTLAKRDFRGYLLSNIINYLDTKAKEYSLIVFGTEDLKIYIDGNDLNISYCDKLLDNLSGGERQRVDLIVQFALRDLLSTQSNYSSNILVLDEIFDNMDRVATENILKLVTTKLTDIESVFIISHHADELELNFDTELKVVKNINGISEVM